MEYERDFWWFCYLLVPSLNMNLHEHYEMRTGTWPEKCIQSLRGLHECTRLWFPPEAASMCPCWSFSCDVPCRTLCVLARVCVCLCVCTCARPESGIHLHNPCIVIGHCPAISSKAAAAGKPLGKTGRRNLPAGFTGLVLWMSPEVSEK